MTIVTQAVVAAALILAIGFWAGIVTAECLLMHGVGY
jgi:hypothetical protein